MSSCCCPSKSSGNHPDHRKEFSRLNRVSGQIDGIKKMIEENRYCPDIMMQLRAARSAIKTIEADILERHLQGCVAAAMTSGKDDEKNQKIDEIKQLFKKYDE